MIPDRRLYAGTVSLRCTVPPAFEPVTLAQAKNHARVDTNDDDALISTMITAARMAAEGRTHRVLCESSWEWIVQGRHLASIDIPLSPCSACSGDGVTLFVPSGGGGVSSPLYGRVSFTGTGEYTLTLTAGYPQGQCPEAIVQWMLVKISSFYEQREAFAVGSNFHEFSRGFVDHLLDPYILP